MDAKKERGQSIIEFVLVLPVFIGFAVVLIRINTAIQVSIVNQQYARSHALFVAMNSPYYPPLAWQEKLIQQNENQLVLGVQDNLLDSKDSLGEGARVQPIATTQMIPRVKNIRGSNDTQSEPRLRSLVRVRNTITLCTQNLVLDSGIQINQGQNLNESSKISSFCRSNLPYE